MIEWSLGKNQEVIPSSDIKKDESSFLSMATHELRTPLSVIKWYTEMLLDGDGGAVTEDQKKYLKVIQSSNQRAIDLIRSLLNVSRLDLGTFSITPTDVDFYSLVEQVFLEDKDRISEKKITTKIIKNTDEYVVVSDKQMCLVVIRNLISNALLFAYKETTLSVTLEDVPKGKEVFGFSFEKESLLVSVSDHGVGIPETDKEKIFSKLFKASNAKDEKGEGSGLGLYIVKSAVDALGGKVWFISENDGITTFYLALPKVGLVIKEGRTVLE